MGIVLGNENDGAPASAAAMNARLQRFVKPQPGAKWPSDGAKWPSEQKAPEDVPLVRGQSITPTLQRQVLEIAKHFSPGPSVHTLQAAAQRLAEAELLHQHAVALVEKMASLPWRDRRFGFNEWQGLASACELWESNIE